MLFYNDYVMDDEIQQLSETDIHNEEFNKALRNIEEQIGDGIVLARALDANATIPLGGNNRENIAEADRIAKLKLQLSLLHSDIDIFESQFPEKKGKLGAVSYYEGSVAGVTLRKIPGSSKSGEKFLGGSLTLSHHTLLQSKQEIGIKIGITPDPEDPLFTPKRYELLIDFPPDENDGDLPPYKSANDFENMNRDDLRIIQKITYDALHALTPDLKI